MIFYLLFTSFLGFVFSTLLYHLFKKNAMVNPEEMDSYIKAATSGNISKKEAENFTVHINKKVAS